jgi:hypothetical protein
VCSHDADAAGLIRTPQVLSCILKRENRVGKTVSPRVTLRGVRCAQASLEAAVEAHGHVLVMFTAEWCGYALNSKL